MKPKHKIGIAGFGGMGSFHAKWLINFDRAEIVGVFDPKLDRAALAEKMGYRAYDSLEDLINDVNIDFILIATPNDNHKDIAIAALRAGKNVLCEKPVAMNSDELLEILAEEKKSKGLFTVHQNRRWDEDYLVIKQIYDESMLGEVFRVESKYYGSRGIPGDWRREAKYGGGMMLDWGVHLIDRVLLLFDEKVTSVYCKFKHLTNFEVDEGFLVVLTFESGKTAVIEVMTCNYITAPSFYMAGEYGTVQINTIGDGRIVKVTDYADTDALPVKIGEGFTKTMAPREESSISELPLPALKTPRFNFYDNFFDAIEGKAEQAVGSDSVLRCMRLIEAAFESNKTGQTVAFEN